MKQPRTILILEDNDERVVALRKAIADLGEHYELKIWRDAAAMIAECEPYFSNTDLISLDHDLNPAQGATTDPGTGLDVAQFLGDFLPVCPVIVHSQNMQKVWSMHNELRFASWTIEHAGGLGVDWSVSAWARCAREILAKHANTWKISLPPDHTERVERMRLSLDGLGLGDSIGEMLSYRSEAAVKRIAENDLPTCLWFHTDDTEMAISICGVLKSHGFINQDALSKRFARRFERDPDRGYGSMTRSQLRAIVAGAKWRETAETAFGGQGSMGNGSAMRVAPLGAYFANDLEHCVSEAAASSLVTHTHPEGVAGAIAVAVAAALAWRLRNQPLQKDLFFNEILRLTPESRVRRGILIASQTPFEISTDAVAKALGNGALVTAPDTVPFCIWMAARHLHDFKKALAETIQVGGDCDTNAAIVGGIVSLSVGREAIPVDWLQTREQVQI